jgi:hypothetical protein
MWVKSIVSSNQFIDAIKCKIYGKSERKLHLLVPKMDSLSKHVKNRRAKVATQEVVNCYKDMIFFSKGSVHVKNEALCNALGKDNDEINSTLKP